MKKCSSINHKENNALSFCGECKIFMCNKCEKYHSELFQNHNQIKLEECKDISEIFSGICTEKNHKDELKYYCKIHNKLCCVKCIAKLKDEENGQHSDCEICFINDIENEKKNKLKENIKCLEDVSMNLNQKIDELKIIFDKIEKNKEEIKSNIQKIFTKLRNNLNDREDALLLEVDNKYNELFLSEEIMKECERLPKKIKISLEKGKEIENNWNKDKLTLLVNNCLNIENNIKEIKFLNENIEKINTLKINMKFYPEEEGINTLLNYILTFGKIGNSSGFDSKIEFDENLILSWLNNRKFFTELLYRKSRDGSTPQDFHSKCDNKGITITLIETTKGYIFGGYTELPWDQSNSGKKDKSTFIFSFNNKQKYSSRNDNDSITCQSEEGPRFGCGWPEIYFNGTLDKGQSFTQAEYSTFIGSKALTNGEENWDVKELEVHKIIYI